MIDVTSLLFGMVVGFIDMMFFGVFAFLALQIKSLPEDLAVKLELIIIQAEERRKSLLGD